MAKPVSDYDGVVDAMIEQSGVGEGLLSSFDALDDTLRL